MEKCIVLAAGLSTRLGMPKQLVRFKGRTLLEHTVAAVDGAMVGELVVVVPPIDEVVALVGRLGIPHVINPSPQTGMGASICLGLGGLAPSGPTMICLVDQPLLESAYLRSMWRAFHNNDGQKIIYSTYEDTIGPPVIFPSDFDSELRRLVPRSGAKSLILNNKIRSLGLPNHRLAFDVDTQADLARLGKIGALEGDKQGGLSDIF